MALNTTSSNKSRKAVIAVNLFTTSIHYFTLKELDPCIDLDTLLQNLAMWRALNRLIEQRPRPLPPTQHILPSFMSLWSRVKGGIDVYPRYLKNVKLSHASLPPISAIVQRIIMTLIYNSFQSLQLFRGLYRDAAKYLRERSPPDATTSLSCRARNENKDTGNIDQNGHEIIYKKRVHFNSDIDLIRRHLNKRNQHVMIQIEDGAQNGCVLFCSLNHDTENAGHGHKGFKTRFECSARMVALCRQDGMGRGRASTKFHSEKELPDPCSVSGKLNSTRENNNRAPPPSRKRPSSMVDTPNRRSPSAHLHLRERRRSQRIRENASQVFPQLKDQNLP
ncbi:hypothetical protein PHYSODRAFT_306418 [Phytophthora sojae]|uniref:Uncharacterized protein n=1 Tax=Phytophthora sojae (strain P6497) TaxID=1094619 RepID=G5A9H7_PHYSP|nr:hypothetical protein PHYSODRAFT_306418 [Phytophthora sojae]EGZ08552.1 hypothetical protein PHYSODRAFT_306418 [Phytophthora sojae]|eukprot:XP_009536724.1 hypothetical protein PHYSODRAFT_306418 [Phytophthora sojae]